MQKKMKQGNLNKPDGKTTNGDKSREDRIDNGPINSNIDAGANSEESNEACTEEGIYETILHAWEEFSTTGQDATTWEGQYYVKLMRMVKDQTEPSDNAARNGLLLILALFSNAERGVDLRGIDLESLNPREKEIVLKSLSEHFE